MKDILTEAEAKTRWCPMGRMVFAAVHADGIVAVNRDSNSNPLGYCIASDCMAWRLSHKEGPAGEETGYCGAFGLPRFT